MWLLVAVFIGCCGLGYATCWWAALIGASVVPIYVLGTYWGWWGIPPGDIWELATLVTLAVGLLGAMVGIILRRVQRDIGLPPL